MIISNTIRETIEIELSSSNICSVEKLLSKYKNLNIGDTVSVDLDFSFMHIDNKSYRLCKELIPYLNKNEQYKAIEYLSNYKKMLCETRDSINHMIVIFNAYMQHQQND